MERFSIGDASVRSEQREHKPIKERIPPPENVLELIRGKSKPIEIKNLDLHDIDFSDLEIEGLVFVGVNFKGALFDRSKWKDCKFIDCVLDEVEGSEVEFKSVTVENCVCENLSLDHSTFTDVQFQIDFKNIRFKGSKFEKVSVDTIFDESEESETSALLDNAVRGEADFSNTTWIKSEINLSANGCNFSGSDIYKCSINGFKQESLWIDASIRSSSFINAFQSGSVFNGCHFESVRFIGGCQFEDCQFDNAVFNKCEFDSIELYGSNFSTSVFNAIVLGETCTYNLSEYNSHPPTLFPQIVEITGSGRNVSSDSITIFNDPEKRSLVLTRDVINFLDQKQEVHGVLEAFQLFGITPEVLADCVPMETQGTRSYNNLLEVILEYDRANKKMLESKSDRIEKILRNVDENFFIGQAGLERVDAWKEISRDILNLDEFDAKDLPEVVTLLVFELDELLGITSDPFRRLCSELKKAAKDIKTHSQGVGLIADLLSFAVYDNLKVPLEQIEEECCLYDTHQIMDLVKSRYKQLAKLYHPDRRVNDIIATNRFSAAAAAFKLISDLKLNSEPISKDSSASLEISQPEEIENSRSEMMALPAANRDTKTFKLIKIKPSEFMDLSSSEQVELFIEHVALALSEFKLPTFEVESTELVLEIMNAFSKRAEAYELQPINYNSFELCKRVAEISDGVVTLTRKIVSDVNIKINSDRCLYYELRRNNEVIFFAFGPNGSNPVLYLTHFKQ